MPLNTQILREGKEVKVPWSYFHLSAMFTAATVEQAPNTKITDDGRKRFKDLGKFKFGGEEFDEIVDFSIAPIYYLNWPIDLLKFGKQIVRERHLYINQLDGDSDERLELLPGDELIAYRSSK